MSKPPLGDDSQIEEDDGDYTACNEEWLQALGSDIRDVPKALLLARDSGGFHKGDIRNFLSSVHTSIVWLAHRDPGDKHGNEHR